MAKQNIYKTRWYAVGADWTVEDGWEVHSVILCTQEKILVLLKGTEK